MWLTSNSPTAVRTALCSWRLPPYCTGMSQPPNSISLALSLQWASHKGVRRRSETAEFIAGKPQRSTRLSTGTSPSSSGENGLDELIDRFRGAVFFEFVEERLQTYSENFSSSGLVVL